MKNTRHSCFSCEFSVCPMSSVCREGRPQCFQRKNQSIQTRFLIRLYVYSTQSLSVHMSWMLEHILFQYSPYSARQEHRKRCPCLFGLTIQQMQTTQSAAEATFSGGGISHSTNALPRARQASSAASSGVSVQITLSQTRFTPALSQSLSQVRIHSPSPQP